jgi:uroporphyrinogen-III decarboxylase
MSNSTAKEDVVPLDNSSAYAVRQKRIDDAMHLRQPDRVPVVPLSVNYYPTRSRGISNKQALHSPGETFGILKEITIRHGWDAAASCVGMLVAFRPLELLGIRRIKWPGGDLAEEQPYKWVESEYMMQDEYDAFLSDPDGFVLKKFWPRISSTLAPVSNLLQQKPFSFLHSANAQTLPMIIGNLVSSAPVEAFLTKVLELAKEDRKTKEQVDAYNNTMMRLGYPVFFPTATYPAFDWISTNLRGLRGALLDMYEVPDRLTAALELITQTAIKDTTMDMAIRGGGRREVFVRMNHNVAEFMSDDQFKKFYWPYFKALVVGLVETGLTPIAVFEGDYTSALKLLSELPPGKIVGHFDRIDRKKAKKRIGDVMCFWGNVPAELLCNGTVQQVKDDVKELIDIFGDTGGLIIDSALGIPDAAKPENVQAMTDAAYEYGVF